MDSKVEKQQLSFSSMNLSLEKINRYILLICFSLWPLVFMIRGSLFCYRSEITKGRSNVKDAVLCMAIFGYVIIVLLTTSILILLFESKRKKHFLHFLERNDLEDIAHICEVRSQIYYQPPLRRYGWETVVFFFLNFIPYLNASLILKGLFHASFPPPMLIFIVLLATVYGILPIFFMNGLQISCDADSFKLIKRLRAIRNPKICHYC